jgi:hypothetical protein
MLNNTVRIATERSLEGMPTVIRKTLNDIEGYDLVRDCNA